MMAEKKVVNFFTKKVHPRENPGYADAFYGYFAYHDISLVDGFQSNLVQIFTICEWTLLNRFTRSEVNDDSETNCTLFMAETYILTV